jgi:hypothetical protein
MSGEIISEVMAAHLRCSMDKFARSSDASSLGNSAPATGRPKIIIRSHRMTTQAFLRNRRGFVRKNPDGTST